MLFTILVIILTIISGGAVYEAHRFVLSAWSYTAMAIAYLLISFYTLLTN